MHRTYLLLLCLLLAGPATAQTSSTQEVKRAMSNADATTPSLVGRKAPAFSLKDQDGNKHSLADHKGQYVVLYFYPKDDTPGCTKEACGFRDGMKDFRDRNIAVYGISILDEASKKKFADKYHLNFPLLADADNKVASAYGVWKEKSMYGKTYFGISRETFIIGPDGKVVQHWDKAKGSEEHAPEVLAWIEADKKSKT